MFGFVTKRQLDQLREDLAADFRKANADWEAIQYEWAKWFNKFRALYAMLLKREKSTAASTPERPPDEADDGNRTPPRRAVDFHSRRGF